MNRTPNKIYFPANLLLAAVAVFTFALTLYSCSRFYAYLPTSDTWVHVDFLAQAAQGHLDVSALFEKHNNTHLIVLPKLVYFFDMWLTGGSGRLVVCISLLALLATAAIFVTAIHRISTLEKVEKNFLGLLSFIFLLSTCQAESLLNPANLQWSLLNFTAVLTAWFAWQFSQQQVFKNMLGVCVGVVLTSLTSASVLLILIPLLLLMASFRFGKTAVVRAGSLVVMVVISGYIAAEMVRSLLFADQPPIVFMLANRVLGLAVSDTQRAGLIAFFSENTFRADVFLASNWLKFNTDFLAPPVERLHSMALTVLVGCGLLSGLVTLVRAPQKAVDHAGVFFGLLLLFVLFVAAVTGLVRSYSPDAFTFRFVNLGLLFAAALFPLMYLQFREKKLFVTGFALVYVGILSYVNVTEASAFGYGRNHVRLNQVAYSLDIRDSFVVSALPGTAWEKIDFNYVQANKHKLQERAAGIYSSEAYKNVGTPISELTSLKKVTCQNTLLKIRRLLPDQAAYRLLGESKTDSGEIMSQVYFVDSEKNIRGFAIPVEPDKNLLKGLFEDEQWAGFVNLEHARPDQSTDEQRLVMYPYNNQEICQGEQVLLPAYIAPKKKEAP